MKQPFQLHYSYLFFFLFIYSCEKLAFLFLWIPNKYILDFGHCCLGLHTGLAKGSGVGNSPVPRTIPIQKSSNYCITYCHVLKNSFIFTSALYPFFQSAVYLTTWNPSKFVKYEKKDLHQHIGKMNHSKFSPCVLPSGNWTRYSPRVTSPSLAALCDCWFADG